MNERKINLEEILNNCVYIDDEIKPMVKNAMKEACRQILELAAENAKVESKNYFEASKEELINGINVYFNEIDVTIIHIVDKQSILDTINKIS